MPTPATHEAFGELVEHLGGQVEEISLDQTTERGIAAARIVQSVGDGRTSARCWTVRRSSSARRSPQQIEEGRRMPGVDYVAALNAREELYAAVEELPASARHHPDARPHSAGAQGPRQPPATPCSARFWTYLGVPAVSLPLLEVDGMPMGVQLIGARGDDGRLLRTARWLARHVAKAD